MPREDRRIFFDYTETFKAVYSLCVQKGLPKPPAGILTKIDFTKTEPQELTFIVESSKTGASETVQYTKDFVVAALMIMCRTVGVPLPKGANKSLDLRGKEVVLYVQMLQ